MRHDHNYSVSRTYSALRHPGGLPICQREELPERHGLKFILILPHGDKRPLGGSSRKGLNESSIPKR